jgi:hypothetical protein
LQGCGMGGAGAAAAAMKFLQLRLASSSQPLRALWPGKHTRHFQQGLPVSCTVCMYLFIQMHIGSSMLH